MGHKRENESLKKVQKEKRYSASSSSSPRTSKHSKRKEQNRDIDDRRSKVSKRKRVTPSNSPSSDERRRAKKHRKSEKGSKKRHDKNEKSHRDNKMPKKSEISSEKSNPSSISTKDDFKHNNVNDVKEPFPSQIDNSPVDQTKILQILETLPKEEDMMKIMGFRNFDSTHNKKVVDNNHGMSEVRKARKYRQYMNRPGGFNKNLDPMT